MLTDCLEACQANESCGAVNYETGLCVLFSANADKLPGTLFFVKYYHLEENQKSNKKRQTTPQKETNIYAHS